MPRAHVYRRIGAAAVVENVSHGRHHVPPPTVERHVRELAKLDPKEQPRAWAEAVKTAPDRVVTAKHVADVVSRLQRPEFLCRPRAQWRFLERSQKSRPDSRTQGTRRRRRTTGLRTSYVHCTRCVVFRACGGLADCFLLKPFHAQTMSHFPRSDDPSTGPVIPGDSTLATLTLRGGAGGRGVRRARLGWLALLAPNAAARRRSRSHRRPVKRLDPRRSQRKPDLEPRSPLPLT